MSEKDKE